MVIHEELCKKLKFELPNFAVPADHRLKIKEDKQVLRPCQRTKKAIEHEDDGDTN